ncbi:MAG: divergent polysaccharide deacetylase family protein [Campylobacteraceae bacterium]|nr:divergent polysaccharide deacetylase family protein [Campylobacteraceae bacterium]
MIVGAYKYTKQAPKPLANAALITSDSDNALMEKMRTMLLDERKRLDEKPLESLVGAQKESIPPEPTPINPQKTIKVEKKVSEKPSEVADYEKSLRKSPKTIHFDSKKTIPFSGAPKLAIIIDDVAFAYHVEKIKQIPFAVTPSILPPTERHPNSHELANQFDVYMVHLPLEAISHGSPESRTLMTNDSYEKIKNWINELQVQFPKATFYNNHTGSKFTENSEAMDRLIRVLKEKNITFLDSRTTPRSVAIEIGNRYDMSIQTRDVFLDNSYEKEAIRTQLKEAVSIAKARGKAIAIGHPHKNTLSVLEHAKPLLEGVEVVYVKEL